jgi:hypothetical protein
MSCRKTQKAQVLAHMRKYGHITTLIAFNRYQICRLSERIRELEDDGHHINKPRTTRNGKTYSVYSLVEWQARAA